MSVLLKTKTMRRTVLRGMLGGGAVTVALPFLDCFLNENGTALAAGGALPVRFGTWFWGLGHSPGFGLSGDGPNIVLGREAMPLEPYKKHMNYFGGFNAALDGKSNQVHYSGLMSCRTGSAPTTLQDIPAPTFDVLISDVIGDGTRFRSLNIAASGGSRNSYSARSAGSHNAAEASPVGLYARVFGPEFVDPNKADFTPDPKIMVRQSVLSGVDEHSKRLIKQLGSVDKERLDAHFTAIRQLEQQLALQLEKPPADEACKVPVRPAEEEGGAAEEERADAGSEVNAVVARHKILAQTLAMAVACNQTKVFNAVFSGAVSGLRKAGEADTHHTLSHEEAVDKKLGYQQSVAAFNIKSMEGLADFIEIFSSIKEGDGMLLDNTLLVAHTDTNDAKVHAIDGIPVMTFGKAGGRIKSGLYLPGNGDPITRVGLTVMQVMGVQLDTWGTKSNTAAKPIRDILA